MIYILLTDGFEEVEALTPADIMRRAELPVKTVSVMPELFVTGSHGITVKADIMLSELDCNDMDMLVLPGGPGHTSLDTNAMVKEIINTANDKGKYIAAICASPSIIGKMGLLKGRKATAFPGFEKYLTGAEITHEKSVIDGNFITARGAGASAEFGFDLVSLMRDKATAAKLKESMQY